jgi:hypothetical protein
MTVSQSIISWLSGNPTVDVDTAMDTDMLAAQAMAIGLYKTPQLAEKPYLHGARSITAYYNFLLRQRVNQESKRQDNQAWLEALERWVYDRQLSRNLPAMEAGRTCQRIFIANSFFLMDAQKDEGVYQLTIGISYMQQAG